MNGAPVVLLSVALVIVGGTAGLAALSFGSSPLLTAFAGAAYVAGETRSPDFPTTAGAFDTTFNSAGGFMERDALLNGFWLSF